MSGPRALLGHSLRTILKARGLKRTTLAQMLSEDQPGDAPSYTSVRRWVAGEGWPDADRLEALARVLEVAPHDLLIPGAIPTPREEVLEAALRRIIKLAYSGGLQLQVNLGAPVHIAREALGEAPDGIHHPAVA